MYFLFARLVSVSPSIHLSFHPSVHWLHIPWRGLIIGERILHHYPYQMPKIAFAPLLKIIYLRRLPSEGNICVSKKVKMEIMYEWKCKTKWARYDIYKKNLHLFIEKGQVKLMLLKKICRKFLLFFIFGDWQGAGLNSKFA